MTTEPQAQTSERVPDLRNMQEASPAETLAFLRERIRADAEKIRALEAGRIEAQHVAQHLSLWRGRAATSRTWDRGEEVDLLGALLDKLDAALSATQSPRSEAGEDVK